MGTCVGTRASLGCCSVFELLELAGGALHSVGWQTAVGMTQKERGLLLCGSAETHIPMDSESKPPPYECYDAAQLCLWNKGAFDL